MTLPQAGEQPVSKYSWVPDLLYGIIDSPNSSALDALYDAVFAAGPAIVPQLEAALPDDRTAEFAAQSLAFIGSEQAIAALAKLVNDPRDLDLRQFYYGALGGLDNPQDNQILLNVVRNANSEPDRAVTDAAIIALTVRSDLALVAPLQQAEGKITDPVIQDDLANAISIIQSRARYLDSRQGLTAGSSIEQALHTYFMPALASSSATAASHRAGDIARNAPRERAASTSGAKFEVRRLEYSPDKNRALARVIFEDPAAIADYWIVLQKKEGGWAVDTAWLGAEQERPEPQHGQ